MENDNKQKYLKRLKIQNTILMIIMIVLAAVLICRVIVHTPLFNYIESTYDDYFSYAKPEPSNEILSFNSQFTVYEGNQTGSKLKLMCGTIIKNANTFSDDGTKIPKVEYKSKNDESIYSDNRKTLSSYEEPRGKLKREEIENENERINEEFIKNNGVDSYIEIIQKIKTSKLKDKTVYNVEFMYDWNYKLDTIIIKES